MIYYASFLCYESIDYHLNLIKTNVVDIHNVELYDSGHEKANLNKIFDFLNIIKNENNKIVAKFFEGYNEFLIRYYYDLNFNLVKKIVQNDLNLNISVPWKLIDLEEVNLIEDILKKEIVNFLP